MRRRSTAAEWMDDAAATEAEFASALRDLARINRWSLAYRPTLRWLDRLVAGPAPAACRCWMSAPAVATCCGRSPPGAPGAASWCS